MIVKKIKLFNFEHTDITLAFPPNSSKKFNRTFFNSDQVLSLAFNIPHISNLETYLQHQNLPHTKEQRWNKWCKLNNIVERFLHFVQANKNKEQLAFIVTNQNRESKCSSPTVTQYNRHGAAIPIPLGTLQAPSEVRLTTPRDYISVTISWSAPNETHSIEYYRIWYCQKGRSKKEHIDTINLSATIRSLHQQKTYLFQVQGVCAGGTFVTPLSKVVKYKVFPYQVAFRLTSTS